MSYPPEPWPHEGTAAPHEGRTIGDYVLGEKLGEGGFGAVYLAHQKQLGREAVLKILRARHAGAEARGRFLREARLASRFDHPFAAHVYDCGVEDDGLSWIAMERVRGTPLDRHVAERGPFTPAELAPLFARICEVVQSAHEQGIVHADIKAANVMVLERAGQLSPKLLDFGLARAEDEVVAAAGEPEIIAPIATLPGRDARGESGSGAEHARSLDGGTASFFVTHAGRRVIGSPLYMAPEQWIDAAAASPRSDLYALGALAFEALTGRAPFAGATLEALERAHAEAPLPSAGLSAELDTFLAKAMAKRPEDRFASALEMGRAFERATGVAARRGPRRRWLIAATIALAAAIVVVAQVRSRTLPWGERRVGVSARCEGDGDVWLARAIERLAARRLADRRPPFDVVTDEAGGSVASGAGSLVGRGGAAEKAGAPNVRLEITCARDGDGVRLGARMGRAGGVMKDLHDVRARSADEALDALLTEAAARAGEGLPERALSPARAEEMRRRGTASEEAFELQRASFDGFFAAVYTDSARFVRMAEDAVAKDPGWARAHASLALMQGRHSEAAKATLAAARARLDSSRDAPGVAALDSLELLAAGRPREAAALLEPVFQADPTDLVAGYLLAVERLGALDATAATSVLTRLHEQRPDLQFGEDLAGNRFALGQREEAAAMLAAWAERAPEAEQVWLSCAFGALAAGRPRDAEAFVKRSLLLFGEATFRLSPVIDVHLAADDPAAARRLGEKMLAGNAFDRARGYRRIALADQLEGRFGSAYQNLQAAHAIARTQGAEGESMLILRSMAALAPLVAPREEQLRVHELLAKEPDEVGAVVAAFERSLLAAPPGACPPIEDAARALPEGPARTSARREMLRAASTNGCAACADVLRAGLAAEEPFADSLFRFAECAEKENALPLARATFTRVADLNGSMSPFHAVLARFHLGRVLARLGEDEAARASFHDFVRRWSAADRPLPELDEARTRLNR